MLLSPDDGAAFWAQSSRKKLKWWSNNVARKGCKYVCLATVYQAGDSRRTPEALAECSAARREYGIEGMLRWPLHKTGPAPIAGPEIIGYKYYGLRDVAQRAAEAEVYNRKQNEDYADLKRRAVRRR